MTSSNRLRKSSKERMIFGVAGGMAEYFDIDPVLMRVIFVIVGLVSAGTAIIAYIILAIVMPGDDEPDNETIEDNARTPVSRRSTSRRNLLALILIVAGVVLLIAKIGILSWWNWDIFWPVLLIVLGLALIVNRVRRA